MRKGRWPDTQVRCGSAAWIADQPLPFGAADASQALRVAQGQDIFAEAHAPPPRDNDLALLIDAMHLEYGPREIQTNRGKLHVDGDSCQRSPDGTSRPEAGAVHLTSHRPKAHESSPVAQDQAQGRYVREESGSKLEYHRARAGGTLLYSRNGPAWRRPADKPSRGQPGRGCKGLKLDLRE